MGEWGEVYTVGEKLGLPKQRLRLHKFKLQETMEQSVVRFYTQLSFTWEEEKKKIQKLKR